MDILSVYISRMKNYLFSNYSVVYNFNGWQVNIYFIYLSNERVCISSFEMSEFDNLG